MDIRHLSYFLEVARQKSFTKAAIHLHITQPTISKMVKNIEDEFGIILFDRSGKHMELTDAGKIIFEQAQQIVHSFEDLSYELEDLMNTRKGTVRIGLPPMVGVTFFPMLLGEFNKKYHQITIQLIEDGAKKVEDGVEEGSLDIGVVVLPISKEKFDSFSFVKKPLMLLVHPKHVLAAKSEVTLLELRNETFILFREDFALHDRILEECIRTGFFPHVILKSSQWDFISKMVAANLGVALLPEPLCLQLDPAQVRAIPLKESTLAWHLAVIWKKNGYLSYAAREWIRFAESYLGQKTLDGERT